MAGLFPIQRKTQNNQSINLDVKKSRACQIRRCTIEILPYEKIVLEYLLKYSATNIPPRKATVTSWIPLLKKVASQQFIIQFSFLINSPYKTAMGVNFVHFSMKGISR